MSSAVFLSYASQDAGAARRICETLRAAGVEVWFDQRELVGGDAWDAKIRKQIRECALFVPIISANTQARLEGYFRIEWKLAAQRTHAMAEEKAFLLPVAIDGTRDGEALVPAEFKQVQWSRLPGGEAPPAFVAQVQRLLGVSETVAGGALTPRDDRRRVRVPGLQKIPGPRSKGFPAAVLMLAAGVWFWTSRPAAPVARNSDLEILNPVSGTAAPISEARRLARQAQEIIGLGEDADLAAAERLTERALNLDDTDAEVWAAASSVDSSYLNIAADATGERVRDAQERARRALSLDPNLFEARRARAHFLIKDLSVGVDRTAAASEAELILQRLRSERPRDQRTLLLLGQALLVLRRVEDAKAVHASLDAVLGSAGSGAWHYFQNGFLREADAALDKAIASKPLVADIGLKIHFSVALHGDLDMAAAALARIPEAQRRTERGVAAAVYLYVWRREPAKLLALLQAVPQEWIAWSINGPRDAMTGDALARLGRIQAAQLSWQQALKQVEARLQATPAERNLLAWKMYLQDALGDASGFAQTKRLFTELPGRPNTALLQYDLRSRNATEEEILAELERGINAGRRSLNYTPNALRLNPAFDKVRTTPRFQALLPLAEANARANDLLPPGK